MRNPHKRTRPTRCGESPFPTKVVGVGRREDWRGASKTKFGRCVDLVCCRENEKNGTAGIVYQHCCRVVFHYFEHCHMKRE